MRRLRSRDESGFTLPELVVAMAIIGAVFVTLTGALILGIRNMGGGDRELLESNAAQVAGRWYTGDVHGAEQVLVDDAGAACGGPAELKLMSPNADRVVAYAVTGVGALVRRWCEPAAAAPVETEVVPQVSGVSASCDSGCERVELLVEQPGGDDAPALSVALVATRRTG